MEVEANRITEPRWGSWRTAFDRFRGRAGPGAAGTPSEPSGDGRDVGVVLQSQLEQTVGAVDFLAHVDTSPDAPATKPSSANCAVWRPT